MLFDLPAEQEREQEPERLDQPAKGKGKADPITGGKAVAANFEGAICRSQTALSAAIPDVPLGACVQFVTNGAWALHDLVRHLAEIIGPAHLFGFTWSITEPGATQLVSLQTAGKLLSIKMVVDSNMSKWSRDACQYASANMLQFKTATIHAKGFTLHNENRYLSVVGSANFSNNPRIEAGTIIDGKEAFDFNAAWLEKVHAGAPSFQPGEQADLELIRKSETVTPDLVLIQSTPYEGEHPAYNPADPASLDLSRHYPSGIYEHGKRPFGQATAGVTATLADLIHARTKRVVISGIAEISDDLEAMGAAAGYRVTRLK